MLLSTGVIKMKSIYFYPAYEMKMKSGVLIVKGLK